MKTQLLTLFIALCSVAVQCQDGLQTRAVAYLTGSEGKVEGNATFTQEDCDQNLSITAYVTGLSPGLHGFHIHEKGDLTNACFGLKNAFNPYNVDPTKARIFGDLGNLEANDEGIIDAILQNDKINFCGEVSIIGRGLIVHYSETILKNGFGPPCSTTQKTNCGVACGVIGIM
ncbi:hypothetical protein ACFFRR_008628 [Megaselia abdita]